MGKHFLRDIHMINDMTTYAVKSLHIAQGQGIIHINIYDIAQYTGAKVTMRIVTSDVTERLIIECGHSGDHAGYHVDRIKVIGAEYLNLSINTEIFNEKLRISFENLDGQAMDIKYYIEPSDL